MLRYCQPGSSLCIRHLFEAVCRVQYETVAHNVVHGAYVTLFACEFRKVETIIEEVGQCDMPVTMPQDVMAILPLLYSAKYPDVTKQVGRREVLKFPVRWRKVCLIVIHRQTLYIPKGRPACRSTVFRM